MRLHEDGFSSKILQSGKMTLNGSKAFNFLKILIRG